MTALRIYLAGDGACDWSRADGADGGDAGPRQGEHATLAALPAATDVEVVVPAARMRTLALALPPVAATKLPAVVRFAVEDQLAGDIEAQHIVIAARRAQVAVVHVIDRRWLRDALSWLAEGGVRVKRAIAESDLVPDRDAAFATWIWRADGGFLVQADGRVTVLDQSDDALPSALLLAFAAAPPQAQVAVRGPEELAGRCAAWSAATGVQFALQPAWSWRDAPPQASAAAPNLITADLDVDRLQVDVTRPRRTLRLAAGWLVAALLLHVGATAAEWASLTWRAAGIERETRETIAAAAPALAGDSGTAIVAAWRRHYAAARHRAGRAAPDDALPLLAVASGGLNDLPAGALRAINYESGQLTLDFDPAAAPAIASAAARWERQGLAVLQATTAGGLRVRITQP